MIDLSKLSHGDAAAACGLRLEHYGHAMRCRLLDAGRVVFDGHMADSWDFMRTRYALARRSAPTPVAPPPPAPPKVRAQPIYRPRAMRHDYPEPAIIRRTIAECM